MEYQIKLDEVASIILAYSKAYSKACQISKMERFAEIVKIFPQNAPSQMFDVILKTPLILQVKCEEVTCTVTVQKSY